MQNTNNWPNTINKCNKLLILLHVGLFNSSIRGRNFIKWTDGERERGVCARAEQKLSRCGERERGVCARAEQKLSRCGERERGVCARGE